MIAIVAAMQAELSAVLAAVRADATARTETVAGRELHYGVLEDTDVVVVLSGVGTAAAAATAAVVAERAEAVIMLGTAGGLGETVNPGDVVVATQVLQHNFDARPLWDRWVLPTIGLSHMPTDPTLTAALASAARTVCAEHRPDLAELGLAAPQVHQGLIVSGDEFVTATSASTLRAELPEALAVEMEGAALAQICHAAGVPFALARTISDRADHAAALDFGRFVSAVAAPYAHDLAVAFLRELG